MRRRGHRRGLTPQRHGGPRPARHGSATSVKGAAGEAALAVLAAGPPSVVAGLRKPLADRLEARSAEAAAAAPARAARAPWSRH
eukprot:14189594-Alexandrium_andersonii.AAC.1